MAERRPIQFSLMGLMAITTMAAYIAAFWPMTVTTVIASLIAVVIWAVSRLRENI